MGRRRRNARGSGCEQRRGEIHSGRAAEQPSTAERIREELLGVQRAFEERRDLERSVGERAGIEAKIGGNRYEGYGKPAEAEQEAGDQV